MEGRSKFLDPSKVPLKQRIDGNIWATLVQVTQMLLILAVLAAMVLCFLPVIQTSQKLQADKTKVSQDIATALETSRRLQQQLELLKNNPLYIERNARDRLNLGRPGEVIFRFDPYQPNPNAPATP
jgi:cell division protein DivIC